MEAREAACGGPARPRAGALRSAVGRVTGPEARDLARATVLVIAAAGVELLAPWPLKVVVDNALGDQPLAGPLGVLGDPSAGTLAALAAVSIVVIGFSTQALGYAASVFATRASESIGHRTRVGVLTHLLRLGGRFHDDHRSADLVNRIGSDVYRCQDGLVAWWETAVPEGLFLVGSLVVLATIDWQLALAALVVCPVLLWIVVARRRAVRRAQERARAAEASVAVGAGDLIRNVRIVQAYDYDEIALRDFGAVSLQARHTVVRASVVEAALAPLGDLVLACGTASVLVLATHKVGTGDLSLGTMIVALTYLAGLYSPIRELSRMSTTLAKAGVSNARLAQVLAADDVPRERQPAKPATPLRHAIRFEDVSFAYPDGPAVLGEVTLTLPEGRTTAIVGATGCGKSTLFSLLMRFRDPQGGVYHVGRNRYARPRRALAAPATGLRATGILVPRLLHRGEHRDG